MIRACTVPDKQR